MSKLFISTFVKKNGKLEFKTKRDALLFASLTEGLREGQGCCVAVDFEDDQGNLMQISKLKAGLRELSRETGETFINVQNIIKKEAGLYDEVSEIYKSFGNCSKLELSDAIQVLIEKGKFVNIDLS